MTVKILLDCDNTMGLPRQEIDDGLALLFLLGREDVDLLGVTSVFGNGTAEQAFQTTRTWLRRWGAPEIPVVLGASDPQLATTAAAGFLAETVAAEPGDVSVVATGPLTNLHVAAQHDKDFYENVNEIVCMGGYLQPLRLGWRSIEELNLSADAAASWHVLTSGAAVTVMSAQLCLQAPFTWLDLARTRFLTQDIRRTIRHWLVVMAVYCGILKFYMWDLLPVIYTVEPSHFDRNVVAFSSSQDEIEKGDLVLGHSPAHSRINVPGKIRDHGAFRRSIFDTWARAMERTPAPQ